MRSAPEDRNASATYVAHSADSIMATPSWTRMGTLATDPASGDATPYAAIMSGCLSLRSTARISKSTSFSTSASHALCANGHVGAMYAIGLPDPRAATAVDDDDDDAGCLVGAQRVATREEPWTRSSGAMPAATGTPPAAAPEAGGTCAGVSRVDVNDDPCTRSSPTMPECRAPAEAWTRTGPRGRERRVARCAMKMPGAVKTRDAAAALMVATSAARRCRSVCRLSLSLLTKGRPRGVGRGAPRFYLRLAFLSDPNWPRVHFALDLRGG